MNPRLLPEADMVVRQLMPVVLEAGRMDGAASELRGLPELMDRESVVLACGALKRIRIGPVPESVWGAVVEETAFWCEAAVLAALEGDAVSFRGHVERATAALASGLPVIWVH